MARKVNSNETQIQTTSTPDKLTPAQVAAISKHGQDFYGQGWNGSDANARAEAIGALVPELTGTGRALVVALRSPFGDANGALKSDGSYAASQAAFNALGREGMGAHFVTAVRAVLDGVVLPAKLGTRAPGTRRGKL